MVLFYEVDLVSTVFYPFFFELFGHVFEILYRVVSIYVVFFEVLHKHENKQIEHNILLKQNENNEEHNIEV